MEGTLDNCTKSGVPSVKLMEATVMNTPTNWYTKYRNRAEFMASFDSEQDYIDAMFVQMIMFNYGVWIDPENLRKE